MTIDFRPSWQTGHTTISGMEAQLPSIRSVMACWEAAKNAGVEMADAIFTGDGHQAGIWEAHVHGAIRVVADPTRGFGIRHEYSPPDPQRIAAFIRHWKRLTSRYDYGLRVLDAVTNRELARA